MADRVTQAMVRLFAIPQLLPMGGFGTQVKWTDARTIHSTSSRSNKTPTPPPPCPRTPSSKACKTRRPGLTEAIQTALGALHKIMIAREMLKSGGLQTPVYVDDGLTDSGKEACVGFKYGQTASGMAVDYAYKQADEGVESAMTQLVWLKQWLDDERSKVLATIVRHGHGF